MVLNFRLQSACALLPLALATAANAQSTGSGPAGTPAPTAKTDEIVVTGTFVRTQAKSASPIQVTSALELSQKAAFTPDKLISSLSINSGSQNNNDGPSQTFSAGTSNVNLRGLGVSSTLVLLDGQRQVSSATSTLEGDQFVDLNSLVPTIAIKRVDVLKDGASTLYGSDAVAGVVNFVTDSRFKGLELSANDQLTTREGQSDAQFQAKYGLQTDRFHLMVAGSFYSTTYLSAAARRSDFPRRSSTSNFGNPQTFLVRGVLTPDPSCGAAAAQYPGIVIPPKGATGYCAYNYGDYFTLVPHEHRYQAFGEADYEVTSNLRAYAQFGYAKSNLKSTSGTSQSILSTPTVPVSNPGNIWGVPVQLLGRPLGPNYPGSILNSQNETWRAVGGLKGDISSNWHWDATYVHAQNRYALQTGDTLLDRYVAALNGVGGPNNDEYFNPLFGASNDPAVISDFYGVYSFVAKSKLDTFDAHVSGTLLDLPAGPLGIAVGYQHRHETLSYDYNDAANANRFAFYIGNQDFSAAQSVNAGFVELNAPVLSWFDLQGALRYEDFGHGTNTWNPKVGFLARPIHGISLRGTYSTSFRAPSMFQTAGTLVVPASAYDPVAGANVSFSQRTSSDPNNPLKPQTSRALNFGATWSSDFGLTASVDYWNFAYKDYITAESAASVLAVDPTGSQITRLSTGSLTGVRTFFRNAGSLDTDGLDFQLNYRLPEFGLGQFSLQGDATRVLSYDLLDPLKGKINGLGERNLSNFGVSMPKWRGNAGFLWNSGMHSANIFVYYVDHYRDQDYGNYEIKSFTSVDIQYSIEIPGDKFGGAMPKISVGLRNLFDRNAPTAIDRSGYDPLVGNPLGRLFYASMSVKFK